MAAIRLIKQKIPLGSSVYIVLKTGQEMEGVLTEIEDDYVMLRSGSGDLFLTDDSISAWKLASNNLVTKSIIPEPVGEDLHKDPIPDQSVGKSIPISSTIAIGTKAASIIEKYKAALRMSVFTPLPPNFNFSIASENVSNTRKEEFRREIERTRNRYEYSLKVKEPGRLDQIIFDFSDMMKKHPSVGRGWYCLGCLYSQADKDFDAIHSYELAIAYSADAEPCYNLFETYFSRKDYAGEFNALNLLFTRSTLLNYKLAWYRFVELAIYYLAIDKFLEIIDQVTRRNNYNEKLIFLEGAVYFLISCERISEGEEVALLLDHETIKDQDMSLVAALLRRTRENSPELMYKRKQKELADAEQQINAVRQEALKKQRVSEILDIAENLAQQGKYTSAISELDKANEIAPESDVITQRRQKYLDAVKPRTFVTNPSRANVSKSSKKYSGPLPTGDGLYAKAKRAQWVEGDLSKAAELLSLSIEHGDNAESAVKDLATVYQQMGRVNDSIKLLTDYLKRASDRLKIYNMLATMYIGSDRYLEATSVYQKILGIIPKKDQAKIFKQIGYCYFKANHIDDALLNLSQVLELNPKDETAKKWLTALQQAKHTGTYNQLDQVFGSQDLLGELTSSISKFLEFYLERCSYEGVQDVKIAGKNFTEADLNKLKGLIEGAGRARPGLRAQYWLSSAKLLMDLEAGDENRLRQSLQQYAIDMGNASVAEQKPREVAIAFYFEGLALSSDVEGNKLRLKEILPKIMMLINVADPKTILAERLPSFFDTINQALKVKPSVVTEILLELTSLSNRLKTFIFEEILRDSSVKTTIQDLCCDLLERPRHSGDVEFNKLWVDGIDHIRRNAHGIEDDLTYLLSLPLLNRLPEHIKLIDAVRERSRWALDKDRLGKIAEILQFGLDYVQEQAYVERERLAAVIKNRVQDLVFEIENSPTKHSLEMYWPYIVFIQRSVDEHFKEVQFGAEPENLECKLSIESYIPDENGSITCQITITNQQGKSPVTSLSVQVLDSPNGEYHSSGENYLSSEALSGGKSITCQIPLRVTEAARVSKVFTLYYDVSFSTRTGKHIDMSSQILPVRLYSEEHFENINNPYASYAEGGPVEDGSMFFGRGHLIDRLQATIEKSSNNKSLIVYGQKRTGKSSIIYHLKKRLKTSQFIPVYFSIGEIIDGFSFASFLYKILQALQDTLYDLDLSVEIERPNFDEIIKSPQIIFHEYMQKAKKAISSISEFRKSRILLLIDEFSYIYTEIKEGRVSETFMKSWKAMLEKGYFGSVLVGQDIMRQFIEAYPNEFQVAQSERVSYLDAQDAKRLMVEPITIPSTGESRYRGVALDRLLSLTAGNPYYVQIFCSQLVRYMNDKKALYITDADIERVKEQLINGNNHLTIDKFDNLINGGDRGANAIPDSDTKSILSSIAIGSRTQPYCYKSAINTNTTVPQDLILDDLIRREVIEKQGASYYRIRVELFKEWLLVHQ